MSELLEAMMVVSFGISWPISIVKSWRSKTAKGKSLIFILFILCGYAFGIFSKLAAGKITYVFVFYVINFVMVAFDACLFVRNNRLDKNRNESNSGREYEKS